MPFLWMARRSTSRRSSQFPWGSDLQMSVQLTLQQLATDVPPPPHVFHYWPLPTLNKSAQLDVKPPFLWGILSCTTLVVSNCLAAISVYLNFSSLVGDVLWELLHGINNICPASWCWKTWKGIKEQITNYRNLSPSLFWEQSRCWRWEVSNSIVLNSFEFSEWSFKQALGYTTLWILFYKMSNFNSLYNPICISDTVSNET